MLVDINVNCATAASHPPLQPQLARHTPPKLLRQVIVLITNARKYSFGECSFLLELIQGRTVVICH
jgi:hypothetical protein